MEQWSLSANKDILVGTTASSSDATQLLYQNLYNCASPVTSGFQPWKGPLIGVGLVLAAAGAIFLYLWKHKTAEQLQQEYQALRDENANLRNQSRHLMAFTKDLKKKNTQLLEENSKVSRRISNLENRMMDLVEVMTRKDENQQSKLLQNFYREQIAALIEENAHLKKKNEFLQDELHCSICRTNEANTLLRPCGHSICSECYYQIRGGWLNDQQTDSKEVGPPCPYCRQTISDLMPKFNS